jgi:hypothetical protein
MRAAQYIIGAPAPRAETSNLSPWQMQQLNSFLQQSSPLLCHFDHFDYPDWSNFFD